MGSFGISPLQPFSSTKDFEEEDRRELISQFGIDYRHFYTGFLSARAA
jgi:hypothetical protein